jgi:hypothetical protein
MSKWLKCTINSGMFSDEYTVIVRTSSGENVSVFVPKSTADQAGGKIRVRVAEQNNRAFAVLPDENQSVVEVPAADLVAA